MELETVEPATLEDVETGELGKKHSTPLDLSKIYDILFTKLTNLKGDYYVI